MWQCRDEWLIGLVIAFAPTVGGSRDCVESTMAFPSTLNCSIACSIAPHLHGRRGITRQLLPTAVSEQLQQQRAIVLSVQPTLLTAGPRAWARDSRRH